MVARWSHGPEGRVGAGRGQAVMRPATGRWLQEFGIASRCNRSAVAEKFVLLNYVHNFRRDHALPAAYSRFQFGYDVWRMHSQILRMVIGDFLDVLIVDQIPKQGAKISRDFDLRCGNELSVRLINHR